MTGVCILFLIILGAATIMSMLRIGVEEKMVKKAVGYSVAVVAMVVMLVMIILGIS